MKLCFQNLGMKQATETTSEDVFYHREAVLVLINHPFLLSIWAPRRHSFAVKIKCLSFTGWSLIDTHHCWIPPSGCHYMCTQKATNSLSSQAPLTTTCLPLGLLVQELHPDGKWHGLTCPV